jgi:hypothetical protein
VAARLLLAALAAGACRGRKMDGAADSAAIAAARPVDTGGAGSQPDSAPASDSSQRARAADNTDSIRAAPAGRGGSTGGSGRATPAPRASEDSVRGTIHVTGSSPFAVPTLLPVGGGRSLTLIGPDTAALKRVSGLEVVVRGAPAGGDRFRVSTFAVRTANGAPALDGVLAREGDALVIVTTDGRRVRLGNPPAAFQDLVGARVWLTGPADTGPNPYGVIQR